MPFPRAFRSGFLFTLCALVLASAGCASWSRSPAAPSARIPPDETRTVRAHLKDGRVLELENAEIVGDSLIGNAPGKLPFDPPRHRDQLKPGPRVAVALADVATLDLRKTSLLKTSAFIVLMVGAAVGLMIASALSGGFF
jgi:hypothetical protein